MNLRMKLQGGTLRTGCIGPSPQGCCAGLRMERFYPVEARPTEDSANRQW